MLLKLLIKLMYRYLLNLNNLHLKDLLVHVLIAHDNYQNL